MITNCIHLDFNKENDLKVPSVQYDSGSRFVKIKLQQNKVPFEINGYRVTVVANKVDGTEIMNDCTILDGANGLVEFEITEQFNAVEGVVDCQLKLFKDEILLTSMPFSISVVKSVSTKEIVSSNELKTLVNALGEVQNIDNRFAQTNAQLSYVEGKLIDPEMFRNNNNTDDEVVNLAVEYCMNNSRELHLYKDYNIRNIVINKNLIVNGHGNKLIATEAVDKLIEVTDKADVKITHLIVNSNNLCKYGVYNNDSQIYLAYSEVHSSVETNIVAKKISDSGYVNTYEVYTTGAKIALDLQATDCKIRRFTSKNANTHLKVSGGGNWIDDFHGWNTTGTRPGSVLINVDLLAGSLNLSNIYADTTETAIYITNAGQYANIVGSNISYFLNRSFYPDEVEPPKLIRGVANLKGTAVFNGVMVDNSAWKDSNGILTDLFDSAINYKKIQIYGFANNGFKDNCYLTPTTGDLYSFMQNETSEYFSPYTRKYYIFKEQRELNIIASMAKSIPNGATAYQVELKEPFNTITNNSIITAYINSTTPVLMEAKIVNGVISVYNNSGKTVSSGSLVINVHNIKY